MGLLDPKLPFVSLDGARAERDVMREHYETASLAPYKVTYVKSCRKNGCHEHIDTVHLSTSDKFKNTSTQVLADTKSSCVL